MLLRVRLPLKAGARKLSGFCFSAFQDWLRPRAPRQWDLPKFTLTVAPNEVTPPTRPIGMATIGRKLTTRLKTNPRPNSSIPKVWVFDWEVPETSSDALAVALTTPSDATGMIWVGFDPDASTPSSNPNDTSVSLRSSTTLPSPNTSRLLGPDANPKDDVGPRCTMPVCTIVT